MENALPINGEKEASSNLSSTPPAPQKVATDSSRPRAASAVDSPLRTHNLSENASATFKPRAHSHESHTHGCGCPKLPNGEGGFYGK